MPFVLLFFAIAFVVVGFRGTTKQFIGLLEQDFVSTDGFLPWAVAVIAIGAVGYVPRIKPLSDAFLVLIIVVMLIANKGFFSDLSTQFGSLGASGADNAAAQGGATSGASSSSAGLNPTGSSLTGSATSALQSLTGTLGGLTGIANGSSGTGGTGGGGTLQGIFGSNGQFIGGTTLGAAGLSPGQTLGAFPQ